MTLIAVHADTDHATLMADTRSSDYLQRRASHDAKVIHLPHLTAAVAYQGQAFFGRTVANDLLFIGGHLPDFDAVLDAAPALLAEAWTDMHVLAAQGYAGARPRPSVLFLVGYSAKRTSFKAVHLASDNSFEPVEIEGLHVLPAPSPDLMSTLEHGRLVEHFAKFGIDDALGSPAPQPISAPASEAEWIELAKSIRAKRALAPVESGLKWTVGGHVFLSTLTRDSFTARRVHTFNDTGAEYAAMLAGTLHPLGQAGPCPCGSDLRLIDCCASHLRDQPCPCGFGERFADCCSIDAGTHTTAPQETVTAH